jgi:hypothetical protein
MAKKNFTAKNEPCELETCNHPHCPSCFRHTKEWIFAPDKCLSCVQGEIRDIEADEQAAADALADSLANEDDYLDPDDDPTDGWTDDDWIAESHWNDMMGFNEPMGE